MGMPSGLEAILGRTKINVFLFIKFGRTTLSAKQVSFKRNVLLVRQPKARFASIVFNILILRPVNDL